ncbi:hypothetical protein DOTSEDRAFT_69148 [Dothistroma septosporum NZE10]|uniref:Uncharacterized protein n=1 Tax=Dothistroma septosporum (strain NZE10 / CBS 128990) TaxID=675120 RepID=N1PXE3_DOTSN|nr:hypothetical protein DOTSEDRAFT_69148 [Dothistroma septosporum NZE10]
MVSAQSSSASDPQPSGSQSGSNDAVKIVVSVSIVGLLLIVAAVMGLLWWGRRHERRVVAVPVDGRKAAPEFPEKPPHLASRITSNTLRTDSNVVSAAGPTRIASFPPFPESFADVEPNADGSRAYMLME